MKSAWLTAGAAFLGAIIAGAVTLAVNVANARRDRLRQSQEERRAAFGEELVRATVLEQLLHRVLNNNLAPVPDELWTQIIRANLDHAAAQARVQLVADGHIVQAVDRLARALTTVMQACRAQHLDEAITVMLEVKDYRETALQLMRNNLID